MIRRALAIVAALLVLLAVLALHALPAASEVPVVSGVVPAGEFVEVTPGAAMKSGALAGASQPARSTPSPSASQRSLGNGTSTPVRSPAAPSTGVSSSPAASVTGTNAGLDKAPAASAISKGTASWFDSPIGVSAAGPALRAAIGPGWRGTRVRVTGPAGSAWTVLGDWMAMDRLVDLDVSVFPAVCGPLSLGLCRAEVTWP